MVAVVRKAIYGCREMEYVMNIHVQMFSVSSVLGEKTSDAKQS